MSKKTQKNKVIEFTDAGQDFLKWIVSAKGEILDCTPFQLGIWRKFSVYNFQNLKIGGLVKVGQGKPEMDIKYPLVNIHETNHKTFHELRTEK